MKHTVKLIAIAILATGGGIAYYFLGSQSDQFKPTPHKASVISETSVKTDVSAPSLIENKISSSQIAKQTIQDKLQNSSVDSKARALIAEADAFIKEHNLTLPENAHPLNHDHSYQTKLENIDKILEQTEEILNGIDENGGTI